MSKKSELKPEVTPFYRSEMPGVIPPFSAKLRMGCMISWEFIDVAWQCQAKCVRIPLAIRWNHSCNHAQCKADDN